MLGKQIVAHYGLSTSALDPYAMADAVLLPLEIVPTLGGGDRSPEGSAFEVAGAEVSSLQRVKGALEVRVFNPQATPATVHLLGRSGSLIDLRGQVLKSFEDEIILEPFTFATLRISE